MPRALQASYLTHLMPATVVVGIGLGLAFVPTTLGAVGGVDSGGSGAGIASAPLNAVQQIGGALGIAVLSAVALRCRQPAPACPGGVAEGCGRL